ncbi:MAG: mannose-6-phosphate isomerase, class I [Pseudonocardiaceae bacterium]|nr:mannose-6-phosphate isomerase, class I [Pseudonocardiaceae bacterium]
MIVGVVYRLSCPVKNYDWGSVGALSQLLGLPGGGEPEAELWIGAHPSAPSLATDTVGCCVALDKLVEADPLLVDGAPGGAGRRLPLLKVLAADRPLSLQVHPDAARAARRFAQQWPGYQDPWHKPEMIYALEPVEVLCGFVAAARAAERLAGLGVAGLAGLVDVLGRGDEVAGIRRAMRWLLTLAPGHAADLVTDVVAAARVTADPAYATVVELAAWHPRDPGVIVALLLNRLTLAPGEAMYVAPNTVHSYLRGVGVEVMAPSDNVLRAGLTSKRVDVAELLEATDYSPRPPRLVTPSRVGVEQIFAPDVDDFGLSVICCPSTAAHAWHDRRPRTVLCLHGSFTLTIDHTATSLNQGDAVFIGAGTTVARLDGAGTLISAAPRATAFQAEYSNSPVRW